ncbi:MAG: peptide ligase PGM1-related protein [Geminocystis sp.]|nr:peptide ligase PGM1-related protein [Geminocystis sp.]MCX8078096.1 peptide ligase PGM1-related protein [Geminocystis sp.]HIK36959.1 carboxylate-amine ligase [Geminocystis sp. M7585_C2015_104]
MITEEDKEKFAQLQNKLKEFWEDGDILDQDDQDILVIPSFSIDQRVGQKIAGFLHYEERLLFSLIRLRNPQTRLIYVTAQPLSPIIIEYYLQLLPGIPFSHARDRLLLLSTYDNSLKPLTQKILERPRLVARIKKFLRPDKSFMVCFNSTVLEQELSVRLGIPLLASSPDLKYWGSKKGSRDIFAECNIPHPLGSELVFSVDKLLEEIAILLEKKPGIKRVVIKLNEGFSGEGNAILDLTEIYPKIKEENLQHNERKYLIEKIITNAKVQGEGETWETFSKRIPELGVIVEEFIEGEEKYSPSVQGYITPNGRVEILSTHDQILGGEDKQIYLGCLFPARDEYRMQLQELGLKIGENLAKKGALERFSVDFLVVKDGSKWQIYAIEINLRKGGTTHPFMTLKFLTNGVYNYQDGLFYSPENKPKYYIASDNLQKPQYHGLLPNDLMDIITKHRLHFDSSTKTGTVFHLMGALSEFGKLGLTSIGNSREEALAIYENVERVLDEETESMRWY